MSRSHGLLPVSLPPPASRQQSVDFRQPKGHGDYLLKRGVHDLRRGKLGGERTLPVESFVPVRRPREIAVPPPVPAQPMIQYAQYTEPAPVAGLITYNPQVPVSQPGTYVVPPVVTPAPSIPVYAGTQSFQYAQPVQYGYVQ